MPPMTVETEPLEPLDVAAATEAVDEAATLRIHDGENEAADVAEANPEATLLDEPIDDEDPEAPAIDYDDVVVGVAVEDSKPLDKTDGDGNQLHEVKVAIATPSPRRNTDASETLAKISEAAEEVREWREKLALLKDEAKEAKENLQGAINRLMRLSSEVANDASRPLLGVAAATGKPVEATARTYQGDPVDPLAGIPAAEPSTATVADAVAADKESWRAYRFGDATHFPTLAAQKAIVAKLAENSPPINTIGDLLDFQKPVEATVRTYQGDPVDPLADMPAAEPSTATVADAIAADKESWRAYRFDDATHFPALAAQKAIVAKLAENSPPIITIGDLLDFQKPVGDYSKTLTDIKGIGTGKAEKIENALEQFWASHPDLVQEAVDAS